MINGRLSVPIHQKTAEPNKKADNEVDFFLVGGEGFGPSKAQGQQIYSLPRLTASVPTHARRCEAAFRSGAAPFLHFARRLRFAAQGIRFA